MVFRPDSMRAATAARATATAARLPADGVESTGFPFARPARDAPLPPARAAAPDESVLARHGRDESMHAALKGSGRSFPINPGKVLPAAGDAQNPAGKQPARRATVR
jgi:hypothetical protein